MPKSDLPRHRRKRDGVEVKPLNVRIPLDLFNRLVPAATGSKRTVPLLVELFIEQGLERMNVDGSGATG